VPAGHYYEAVTSGTGTFAITHCNENSAIGRARRLGVRTASMRRTEPVVTLHKSQSPPGVTSRSDSLFNSYFSFALADRVDRQHVAVVPLQCDPRYWKTSATTERTACRAAIRREVLPPCP